MQKERCLLGYLDAKAFTLIELLVVVLIIGILAAVALPQYQKAVEKSRMVEGIMLVSALGKAEERFFLANGFYTADLEALDIDIPGTEIELYGDLKGIETKDFACRPYTEKEGYDTRFTAVCLRKPLPQQMSVGYSKEGSVICLWLTDKYRKICQSFGQTPYDDASVIIEQ